MTRLKLAELTSGVGALVIGVGLGALFPRWFGPTAGVITVVGLSLHAFGMWDKHRLDTLGHGPDMGRGPLLGVLAAAGGHTGDAACRAAMTGHAYGCGHLAFDPHTRPRRMR
jgi:hypothetical protein